MSMLWSPDQEVSKDFSLTRSELIGAALRKLGVYDHGANIPAEEMVDAAFALNVLIKEWSMRGIDIFVRERVTLLLETGKEKYLLGRSQNDEARYPYGDAMVFMGLTTRSTLYDDSWIPGQSTIKVNKTTGGIFLTTTIPDNQQTSTATLYYPRPNAIMAWKCDSGRWAWAAPSSVNNKLAGSGVEPDDYDNIGVVVTSKNDEAKAGSGETASTGAPVYYAEGRWALDSRSIGSEDTRKFGLPSRPVKILSAYRRNPTNRNDAPVELIGETEYARLNLKHQTGPTTSLWYNPKPDYGELYVWPTGDSNYTELVMNCVFHADDMDAASDNPSFPIEWANALIFHLAHDLAPEYGVDRQTRGDLFAIGERKLNDLLDFTQENASVTFTMDQRVSGAE